MAVIPVTHMAVVCRTVRRPRDHRQKIRSLHTVDNAAGQRLPEYAVEALE